MFHSFATSFPSSFIEIKLESIRSEPCNHYNCIVSGLRNRAENLEKTENGKIDEKLNHRIFVKISVEHNFSFWFIDSAEISDDFYFAHSHFRLSILFWKSIVDINVWLKQNPHSNRKILSQITLFECFSFIVYEYFLCRGQNAMQKYWLCTKRRWRIERSRASEWEQKPPKTLLYELSNGENATKWKLIESTKCCIWNRVIFFFTSFVRVNKTI